MKLAIYRRRYRRYMKKPKVAIYGFTGCSGCQLEILDLEEALLDIFNLIDIVNFEMMGIKKRPLPKVDISFVEGSISKEEDIKKLKEIRKKSKKLIAIGSCACFGGVQSLRNFTDSKDVAKAAYDMDDCPRGSTDRISGIDEYVAVDYYLPGCPIDRQEFLNIVKKLVLGRSLKPQTYPLCVECKRKGIVCLLDRGILCLGPIVRAGCGALCPSLERGCEGCRGMVVEANLMEQIEIMKKMNFSKEDIIRKLRIFAANQFKEVEKYL
jgi:coenzyme F420-reducing hydrogenase gamma subunit